MEPPPPISVQYSVGRNFERRSSSRRHHSRRIHMCGGGSTSEDRRPTKRLFTPEIKRFLKSWLVRRRDNPYPNRDEKKTLAIQTGLTYVQVCNWFANWRRKLKNAGGEPQRSTWGHLIKVYNDQAQGNVEHFSICSDDSIWEEPQNTSATDDHCYTSIPDEDDADEPLNGGVNGKYKNHMMEKYMRDLDEPDDGDDDDDHSRKEITNQVHDEGDDRRPQILSKWLQSAVNFKPRRENYVDWDRKKSRTIFRKRIIQQGHPHVHVHGHGREELDAAETLTKLACTTSASAS